MTVTVTLIRHGESTDNLRNIWAGWRDSPLSSHGMNQAKALGVSLSNTRFTAIHASTLQRALQTAHAVLEAQPEPKPLLFTSPLLREQTYGKAEGQPWLVAEIPGLTLEEHFANGVFPLLHDRSDKFPDGESLDDLGRRAAQAVEEIIMPYVWKAAEEGGDVHVAVASHGLCISELIVALLGKDGGRNSDSRSYRGLRNTAWARMTIDVKDAKEGKGVNGSAPLYIKVTDFNRHEHLDNLKRQSKDTESSAFTANQKDIQAFFGGALIGVDTEAEGRSQSNALDGAAVVTDRSAHGTV